MKIIDNWLKPFRQMWEDRFDRLNDVLTKLKTKKNENNQQNNLQQKSGSKTNVCNPSIWLTGWSGMENARTQYSGWMVGAKTPKTNTVRDGLQKWRTLAILYGGPDGSRHYCRADYNNIVEGKSFEGYDGFCDEKGVLNLPMPQTLWKVSFTEAEGKTQVIAELTYGTQSDLEKIIEMGFEQGFAMAHDNLDELLPTFK